MPRFLTCVLLLAALASVASAQVLTPPFNAQYSITDLGSPTGVPSNLGGLTVSATNPNVLLIGGNANTPEGALWSIGVTRDLQGHITGFTGPASRAIDAAYNDGGVTYGPGGVLFLARWPVGEIGQTKPGSVITDKISDLDVVPLTVNGSPGGVAFVPPGYPGAGQLKIVTWAAGDWYTLGYNADGSGTYNLTSSSLNVTIPGGPEGMAYIPIGSPLFPNPSVIVSEYSTGTVGVYDVDANGNPILATRRDFITGLTGAEGALIDPVTGDYLFSTFGGGNRLIVVKGFAVPEPSTLLLGGIACALFGIFLRRGRRAQ